MSVDNDNKGSLSLLAPKTQVVLLIKPTKTNQGAPNLKMLSCKVLTNDFTVEFEGDMENVKVSKSDQLYTYIIIGQC